MSSPWVTSQYSSDCQIEAFEEAVLAESFKSILGTCRCEAAGSGRKRRDAHLIETDEQHKRKDEYLSEDCCEFTSSHC
jgi:hypothetical protein